MKYRKRQLQLLAQNRNDIDTPAFSGTLNTGTSSERFRAIMFGLRVDANTAYANQRTIHA
jgi:hypothetical protein